MKSSSRFAILMLAFTTATAALAHSGGGQFTLTRSVIGGGGGSSAGNGFSLTGTIGQPVTVASEGGGFSVAGGFWVPGERSDELFSNGFEE